MTDARSGISPEMFERQFILDREKLRSYLFRLTTNRDDADDLVQETFIKASANLRGFKGKSSPSTWIFAIATNLANDHFRARSRWLEDTQDRCREETQASPAKVSHMRSLVEDSPAEAYDFREHIDYCFTCLAKTLEMEKQLALILKDVYRFSTSEIAEILNVSAGRVKHALHDARSTMTDIFDRRCTLVSKQGVCHQCSEIAGFVNPKQAAREAELKLDLVREAAEGASTKRLFDLRMELVRNLDPLLASQASMHEYLLELMGQTGDD